MSNELIVVLLGGLSALIGAAIQYRFQRLSTERQERRELIETHFLQLQNALESLYYRINNLRDWGGKRVMTDDYFRLTSVYAIGRVLAYESLSVSKGIYAKLHRDETLKRQLKAGLHRLNLGMDDQRFLHYHRVQLAEMLLDEGKVLSYTDFLSRTDDAAFQLVVTTATAFVESVEPERLDEMRAAANELIRLLEAHTRVPSALSLAELPPFHWKRA